MVFLPATFVSSLFSMGFFDFEQNTDVPADSRLRVGGQFWIYFAVVIPLTMLVLGICFAWLQWSNRHGDDFGDSSGSGTKRRD
jgi:hypothetical protein